MTVLVVSHEVEKVEIQVEDEGRGVPYMLREKIFHPWVKLTDCSVPGVGLGLFICRCALEVMQGSIWCGGRRDGRAGACFTITFPASVRKEGPHEEGDGSLTELSSLSVSKLSSSKSQEKDDMHRAICKVHSHYLKEELLLAEARFERDREKQSILVSMKQVIHSFLQHAIADFLAKSLAFQHGQEIASFIAFIYAIIAIFWTAVFSMLIPGLTVSYCTGMASVGYILTLCLPTAKSRGCALVLNYYLTTTIALIFFDFASHSTNLVLGLIPMVVALLHRNFWLIFVSFLVTSTTSTLVAIYLHDDYMLRERVAVYEMGVDVTCHLFVLIVCVSYEMQWRVQDHLREQTLKNISQDLRTPLFAIVCAAEVMKGCSSEEDGVIKDAVQTIEDCGSLLTSLVNDMLDGLGKRELSSINKHGKSVAACASADQVVLLLLLLLHLLLLPSSP